MRFYLLVQTLIIAGLLAWSVLFAARRLFPAATRRVQATLAGWMERPSHAPWLQRFGRALQPVQAASGGCGSGGCSTCGTCAAPAQAKSEARPLVFHPRSK